MNRQCLFTFLGDFRGPVVCGANLWCADLQDANLRRADLRRADLWGADLRGADFWCADLQDANLRGADLQGANLRGADLRGADLQGAHLRGADLRGAHLRGADLRGADLRGAHLHDCGQERQRGYRRLVIKTDDGPRFIAGCHQFTFAEARSHWGSYDYPDRERGDEYLRLIDYAESEAHARGWIKA